MGTFFLSAFESQIIKALLESVCMQPDVSENCQTYVFFDLLGEVLEK